MRKFTKSEVVEKNSRYTAGLPKSTCGATREVSPISLRAAAQTLFPFEFLGLTQRSAASIVEYHDPLSIYEWRWSKDRGKKPRCLPAPSWRNSDKLNCTGRAI